jgi:hypothetical protein
MCDVCLVSSVAIQSCLSYMVCMYMLYVCWMFSLIPCVSENVERTVTCRLRNDGIGWLQDKMEGVEEYYVMNS